MPVGNELSPVFVQEKLLKKQLVKRAKPISLSAILNFDLNP